VPSLPQIGALITHVLVFWRKDIWASVKALRTRTSEDRHHAAMVAKYQEVPLWWYPAVILLAFVLGIAVTTTQNITMPAWSYIIALLVGAFVAPFVSAALASCRQPTDISPPSCTRVTEAASPRTT
jgi:hypothetical protein